MFPPQVVKLFHLNDVHVHVITCISKVLNMHVHYMKYVQTSVLDEACRTHPNAWWWIKTDGCDLVSGLCESTKLEWSGDVDFNDGQLQKMHENYRQYLTFVSGIGLEDRWNPTLILEDLCTCSKRLAEDVSFILTSKYTNTYM